MKIYPLLKGYDGPEDQPGLVAIFSTLESAIEHAEKLESEDSYRNLNDFSSGTFRWVENCTGGDIVYSKTAVMQFESSEPTFLDDTVIIREMELQE